LGFLQVFVLSLGPFLTEQAHARSPDFAEKMGFVSLRGTEFIAPDGAPLRLKGINLGNWLLPEGYMFGFSKARAPWQIEQMIKELLGTEANNAFWRQWRTNFITEQDIRYIRSTGANMVRVPFDFRQFTPQDHPEISLRLGFALLDKIVDWSSRAHQYDLFDMHAAPCAQTGTNIDNSYGYPRLYEDSACRARTEQIWRRIARHYARNRQVIGYDLLNEPIPNEYLGLNPELEPLYKEIASAIRQVDVNHILFISGAQWGSNFDVFRDVHFDRKLAYTFHMYWREPNEQSFASPLTFSKKHQVPIFLGESGENTDEWINTFRTALDKKNIGWAFWTYKRLDTTRSMRTYRRPEYWNEIVSYEEQFDLPLAERRKALPSAEHSRMALSGLLRNIRFVNTQANPGFVNALGFRP
jgi:endoglucanase